MLSFKDDKAMKPSYEYYETDLDTIDEQPIDFSKRYDDQLADDVCGASSAKKRHLSNPSEHGVPNKVSGDELRVFCIEGTPLLISSASSLCDLNEIGALIQGSENEPLKGPEKNQPLFQTPLPNGNNDASSFVKDDKSTKSKQDLVEVKEDNSEAENASRIEETFSKASSPLMFSRSSSICSLNSFEQHSIVDDRSSVSMFSNLASGIISPSEIPDSPGEAMSPFIHKRQTEFVFPSNHSRKPEMDPVLDKLKMASDPPFIDEVFEDNAEDNLKVYNDEGDCCSVSNLSALSIQADSLNRVSVAVFHKNNIPAMEHKSSIRISCSMVTGNAELKSIDEDLEAPKIHSLHDLVAKGNCTGASNNHIRAFTNYTVSDEMDDSQDEKINFSNLITEEDECKDEEDSPAENFSYEEDFEPRINSFEKSSEEKTFIQENESSDYSKENSDDEDDVLLEECIKSGMPANVSTFQKSSELSNKSCQSNEDFQPKEQIEQRDISNSDCDTGDSDEEDLLLQSCIQLGMPQKSSNELVRKPVLADDVMDKIAPSSSPDESPRDFSKKMDVDENSDDEEYDPLLQQMIQLGEPKKEFKGAYNKNMGSSSSPSSDTSKLGYRDNRPDGTSEDEDDDDDILTECIQAGMPKPKSGINEYKTLSPSPIKVPCMKPLPLSQRISSKSKNRAACMSSFPGLQPHKKSPTSREHSTMHTATYSSMHRPDGTSEEEDDDDDILTECIQAGMPKPRPGMSEYKKSTNLSTKVPCVKPSPQPQRISPRSKNRVSYMPSFPVPQPCKKLPQSREHSTMHPPTYSRTHHLHRRSPTNDDRSMPLSSHAKMLQGLPHRKTPTAKAWTVLLPPGTQSSKRSSTGDCSYLLNSFEGSQPLRKSPTAECRGMYMPSTSTSHQHCRSPARTSFSNADQRRKSPETARYVPQQQTQHRRLSPSESKANFSKKYWNWIHNSAFLRDPNVTHAPIPDDATYTFRTEDTPILSPSASLSDLSTLSFSEDRMYLDNSLNNSRDSDCSSESDEDELLQQCIRSGMPSKERAFI